MDFAILWLPVLGALLIGAGLAIWGFTDGNRTIALWIGFWGALLILVAMTLYLQQGISNSAHSKQEVSVSKQQGGDTSEIAKKQARAYIFSTASELRNFGTPKRITGVIELKNMGSTPAYKLRRYIEIFWSPYPCKTFPAAHVGVAEDTLGPGALVDLGPVSLGSDLTPEQTAMLVSGKAAIYLRAEVQYFDSFGDKHHMAFRSYFRGDGSPISPGVVLALVRDETGGNGAD